MLIAVGKKASLASGTKKFYKSLYEVRSKRDRQSLANCALLEVEEVGDVIGEVPDRLAIALQFFLQGIGNRELQQQRNLFEINNLNLKRRSVASDADEKRPGGSGPSEQSVLYGRRRSAKNYEHIVNKRHKNMKN